MKTKGSLKANFIYNVVYQALTMLTPLITAPYLSRVLGSSGVGQYSYTYSIANYFVLFAMLGINNHGCRLIASAGDDKQMRSKLFWEVFPIQLASSAAVLVAYLIFICCFVSDLQQQQLLLIWTVYVVSAAVDINWCFFGLEMFKLTTTRNAIIKLAMVVLTFLVVKSADDLAAYTLVYALGLLVAQLVLWPFINKEVRFVRPTIDEVKQQVAPVVKLFIPVVAVSFYTSMDTVILGAGSTMSEVGIFEYSSKFVGIPNALITSLGTVMMPRMVSINATNEAEGKNYLLLSMGFSMALVGAFAFGLIGVSHDLATVFLGPEFSGCEQVLFVMCLSVPFIAWANVIRTQFLIPNNMDSAYTASVVAGGVVNVALGLLLHGPFGALGIAVSYLVAQITVCVVQSAVVARKLPLMEYAKEGAPFLVCGFLMAALVAGVSSCLSGTAASLVVEILVGAITYTSACLFMGHVGNNLTARTLSAVLFETIGVLRKREMGGIRR